MRRRPCRAGARRGVPARGRCILRDCLAPAEYAFLGVHADGTSVRLTTLAGRRVRSCRGHLTDVMGRLAALPGIPVRIRAVHLGATD